MSGRGQVAVVDRLTTCFKTCGTTPSLLFSKTVKEWVEMFLEKVYTHKSPPKALKMCAKCVHKKCAVNCAKKVRKLFENLANSVYCSK